MRALAPLAAVCALLALAGCGRSPQRTTAQPATGTTASASADPSPEPSSAPPSSPPSSPAPVAVPAGVTAAFAVFDRQTGTFVDQRNLTMRFRSASLVKLLIVLDYLWNRGPTYAIPAADRPKLDVMLRSSDDSAATYFWKLAGQGQIVSRMVTRLGLPETGPPPVDKPGFWGYTAVSAGDLVRVYRYLLDKAPAPVRDYVMGNLHQSTKCGTDGYDQSFGIPSAFNTPWAAKQGWSGFGNPAPGPCASHPAVAAAAYATGPPVDLVHKVLHTTGVVGTGDRTIVVVLSLYPSGTAYSKAFTTLTQLTRTLHVPS
jgi:hypothetical protein